MRRRLLAFFCTAALLLAVLPVPSFLEAQNGSTSEEAPAPPESPLPLRLPQEAPPSPEVPLPDASGHLRQGRIEWTGEIDPDLSWIGSPWDYLPPIDEEPTTDSDSARQPGGAATPELTPAPATPTPTPTTAPTPEPPEPATREPAPEAAPPPPPPASREAVAEDPRPDSSAPGSPRLPVTTAPVGEVTGVSLPGAGWIYVGAIPRDADLDLIESQSGAGETLFRFRPWDSGEILLSFQRQDMVTGNFEESTLLLSVLEAGESIPESAADSEFLPAVGEGGVPEAAAPGDDASPERPALELTTDGDGNYGEAWNSLAEGLRQEALQSFLRHYDGAGSPELNQEIASLAIDLGYDEIAAYFWEQNLSVPTENGSAARRGLMEQKVTSAPIPELEEFFLLLEDHDEMPAPLLLLGWARRYDAEGPTPDIRRAVLLYDTLTNWYPGAPEALEAEQRLRFLRRHFLEIR